MILHDLLVGPAVLDMARREALKICTGKRAGRHFMPQDEINETILHHTPRPHGCAAQGRRPRHLRRAGEEAALLRAHGIEVHCVPGITAALGCSASAGLPLTHRGEARVLHVATGHCRAGDELDLDWTRLADPAEPSLYMGRGSLRSLAGNLMAHGLPADTPAVAIENGTLANERRLFAPLADLPEAAHDLTEGPVLVIVGSVVRRAPDWPLPAHADPLGQVFDGLAESGLRAAA